MYDCNAVLVLKKASNLYFLQFVFLYITIYIFCWWCCHVYDWNRTFRSHKFRYAELLLCIQIWSDRTSARNLSPRSSILLTIQLPSIKGGQDASRRNQQRWNTVFVLIFVECLGPFFSHLWFHTQFTNSQEGQRKRERERKVERERERVGERGSAPRMCLLSGHTNQTVVSVRCHCIVLGQVASDHGCHIDD